MFGRFPRTLLLVAAGLLVPPAITGCGSAARSTTSPADPTRIVSLTLATDEILADLVPIERMAGVTFLADDVEISNIAGRYPPNIPRVRDKNVERIIAIAPDLVCVAPYNTADSLELLERAGLPLFRTDNIHSFDEIAAGVERLGERVNARTRAHELVARMHDRRTRLAQRLGDLNERPRVLFWTAGFTAGRKTTLDDVIRDGGGANAALERNLEGSVELSPERVVAIDPDWILLARWKGDERQTEVSNHPILRQLRAVREGHVAAIEGRYVSAISPYAVEAAERLARLLHPSRFSDEAAR